LTSIARCPQRFGFVLASLRQQRDAGAAPHSGDNNAVAPPVPIPNTEVKRCSPDGSTAIGRARVGRRQNRAPSMSRDVLGVLFWRRLLEQRTGRVGTGEMDGQARLCSGRARRGERINRTSPEPSTLLAKVLGFSVSGERTCLACWRWRPRDCELCKRFVRVALP
jgi:hypothetical protein